jgi:hypothetical protein
MKRSYWREEGLLKFRLRLNDAIEETRAHGDLTLAAVIADLDLKALQLLLIYDGDNPLVSEASLALYAAQQEGKQNRREYAKRIFLDALSRHASIVEAVASQKWFSRQVFERERINDPEFDLAWTLAMETAVDKLRAEAWRRGAEGVEEPVVYKGEFSYQSNPETGEKEQVAVKKYSDAVLLALLKRYDPAFRERTGVDLTASVEGGLTQEAAVKALSQLSSEELTVLNKILKKDESHD